MKKLSVYPLFLILLGSTVLFTSACNRKSGCAALDQTTKPAKKKPARSKDLFGHRP